VIFILSSTGRVSGQTNTSKWANRESITATEATCEETNTYNLIDNKTTDDDNQPLY